MTSPPACWNALSVEPGTQRIGEEVAAIGQQQVALDQVLRHGLEVVGPPVGAVDGVVPFQDAVVAGDARAVEAGPGHAFLLDVDRGVDAQLALQLREVDRQLQ